MITYQDLLAVPDIDRKRINFVDHLIKEYKDGEAYKQAVVAEDYYKHINTTITKFQKLLYTITGAAVPDNYSADYKMKHNFFRIFTLQEAQYLLGNGVTWENEETADKLGKDFDTRLQEITKDALVGGVAYGFFNLDHLEVFTATEFAPLYDEEDGAMKAGVRFWKLAPHKAQRATLYELDGYTEYIWRPGKKGEILHEKRAYIEKVRMTEADGMEIYDLENYPTFPVVPLWGSDKHQSELIGIREQIDCYDLIKSGFANDVDEASMIYWTIQNGGGMDDIDLAKFVERMKTVHAAVVEDAGAKAEAHSIEVPYNARETLLTRISKDLYRDAMALDTESIAGGAITATQIRAAYEPLNSKTDDLEYCLNDFLDGILLIAGIEDTATFTRSKIVNVQEEVQTILQAGEYLESDYITKKILTLLGDGDLADSMLDEMTANELDRFPAVDEQEEGTVVNDDNLSIDTEETA